MIPYPCWLPSASAVRIRNVASCIARSVTLTLYTAGLAMASPPELPSRCGTASLSDRFRVHHLRHIAASLMIQAGYPPKVLQEIMGHAGIATTLDLYGHLFPARWTATRTA